jgi:hypothetical protein
MKKIYLALIIGILLLGIIVYAQISKTKDIETSREIIEAIKKDANIQEISITSTPITCDDNYCYSTLVQEGLINLNWKHQRAGLTIQQIEDIRDNYVSELIENYGRNLLGKDKEQVSDETIINFKEKK